MAQGVCKLLWIRRLLTELDFKPEKPMNIGDIILGQTESRCGPSETWLHRHMPQCLSKVLHGHCTKVLASVIPNGPRASIFYSLTQFISMRFEPQASPSWYVSSVLAARPTPQPFSRSSDPPQAHGPSGRLVLACSTA
ncbi:unnamed protein product [Prunus armeniaca]|uniref:Uncharacterized protein n=1 Tax=Prunus armeniaca TaxID=36596 RepID=A0A6J5VJK8_PRUAR|nr:unnamed protein product [Prunus armeniaca]